MRDKESDEMTVFREFAEARPLPFNLETVENRKPPEPDILCGLDGGGAVAFELVSAEDETADKANPGVRVPADKVFGDNFALQRAIQDCYLAAVEKGEIDSPERFHYHTVHVHFEDSARFKQSKKSVPEVVETINRCHVGANLKRNGLVRCIEIDPYPIPCDYAGPMFHVNSSACNVGLTVVARIKDKLEKKYRTTHPIHLLVYSQSRIAAEVDFWRADLLDLIAKQGMGPFTRIWVYGRYHSNIVFDLVHPTAQ